MTLGVYSIESITSPVMMNCFMAPATKRCESDNAFSLREVFEAQLANEGQPANDNMQNQQGDDFERAAPGRKVSIRDLISKQRCFGEEVKGRRDTLSILNEVDLDDSINFDDLTVYKVPSTDVEKESGFTESDLTDQRSSLHSLTSESVDQFNPFDSIDDRKKSSLLLGLSAEFSDLDEDDWVIGNMGAQPPITGETTEPRARHGRRHGRRHASSQSSHQKSTASCHSTKSKRERSKHVSSEADLHVVKGEATLVSLPVRETRSIKPERDTLFPQEQASTPAQHKKPSSPEEDLKKMFVVDSSVKSTTIKKLPSSAQNDLKKMFVVDVAASPAKPSHHKSLSTSRRGSSSHHHHSSLNRSMNRSNRSSSSSHKPSSKSSSSRSQREEDQKSVFDSSYVSASTGEPNDSQVECKHRRHSASRTSQHDPARRRRSDAGRDATISAIDVALHLCHAVAQDDDYSDEIEVFAASKATRSRHPAHSSICSSADDQSRASRSRRSSSSLRGRSDESTATPVPATPLKRRVRKSTRRTHHTNLLSEHMSRQSSDSIFARANDTPSVLSSGSDLASFFEMEPSDNSVGKPVNAFHGEKVTRRSRNRAQDVIGTLYQ